MAIQSALIVDDSKLARVTLRKKLAKHGVEADLADSAEQAMEKIQTSKPEIVFMDHLMPTMDGFEATQIIRQMPGMQDLPIVMCTGKDHEGYLDEARAIGANSTLAKPPTEESLASILNTDFSALSISSETASQLDDEIVLDMDAIDLNAADVSIPVEVEPMHSIEAMETIIPEPVMIDAMTPDLVSEAPSDDILDRHIEPEHVIDLPLPETDVMEEEAPQQLAMNDEASEVDALPSGMDADSDKFHDDLLRDLASDLDALTLNDQQAVAPDIPSVEDITQLVNELVAQQQAAFEKTVVDRVAQETQQLLEKQTNTLSVEDINMLVKSRIQTLWKKNAAVIGEKMGGLKKQIDRVEGVVKVLVAEKRKGSVETPQVENSEKMLELVEAIAALDAQLKKTKQSATVARHIGFIGFVFGASAIAYLVARTFHFI